MPWNVTVRCRDGFERSLDYAHNQKGFAQANRAYKTTVRAARRDRRACRVAISKWSTSGKVTNERVTRTGRR